MEPNISKHQALKAVLIVAVAKLGVAVTTILYELAMHDRMLPGVLITYRYLIASLINLPLAWLERNERPKATWSLVFQGVICATLIGPLSQHMYALSMSSTSTAYVAAISNLISPLTFMLALIFRLEELDLGLWTGKAKVIGTLVGVGGAMLLTFYKGPELTKIKSIHIFGQSMQGHMTAAHTTTDQIIGFAFALAYSLFHAAYYNIQSNLSRKYPCHYTTAFLYSVIGFMESAVYALIMERGWSFWSLSSKIRLCSAIIQGVCSALSTLLIMTAVHLQGPLFVSSFNPMVLVFVMGLGCFILSEQLHLGSLLGSMLIISGLYLVLWAKKKETTPRSPTITNTDQ